jgi:prophage regulatory protein
MLTINNVFNIKYVLHNPRRINMNTLPSTGFLKIRSIIGDPNANPPIPALIPVSKSTWWAGCKSGKFPAPVKLGERCTAWTVESIRAYIDSVGVQK